MQNGSLQRFGLVFFSNCFCQYRVSMFIEKDLFFFFFFSGFGCCVFFIKDFYNNKSIWWLKFLLKSVSKNQELGWEEHLGRKKLVPLVHKLTAFSHTRIAERLCVVSTTLVALGWLELLQTVLNITRYRRIYCMFLLFLLIRSNPCIGRHKKSDHL